MKFAKHFSIFAAVILAAGLWVFGLAGYAGALDGRCVRFCGGSSSGGGGGEGALASWFRERRERYEREREEERKDQQEYSATVEWWSRISKSNEQQHLAGLEHDERVRQENLLRARRKAEVMHAWNDLGVEAYESGDLGNAITYFKAARRYGPGSNNIRHNLERAESKLSAKAESYLSSLQTTLAIAELSPNLLIFHPDPHIRAEANKELAKKAMEDIAEAAAAFVAEERLNGGTIKPFPWETEAERMKRRQEATLHADRVESLRLEAHEEARRLAEAVMVPDSKEDIRIQTKPAMEQLLKVCISGFQ